MIIYKMWVEVNGSRVWRREGWFLFGVVPLYIRDLTVRPS